MVYTTRPVAQPAPLRKLVYAVHLHRVQLQHLLAHAPLRLDPLLYRVCLSLTCNGKFKIIAMVCTAAPLWYNLRP